MVCLIKVLAPLTIARHWLQLKCSQKLTCLSTAAKAMTFPLSMHSFWLLSTQQTFAFTQIWLVCFFMHVRMCHLHYLQWGVVLPEVQETGEEKTADWTWTAAVKAHSYHTCRSMAVTSSQEARGYWFLQSYSWLREIWNTIAQHISLTRLAQVINDLTGPGNTKTLAEQLAF